MAKRKRFDDDGPGEVVTLCTYRYKKHEEMCGRFLVRAVKDGDYCKEICNTCHHLFRKWKVKKVCL